MKTYNLRLFYDFLNSKGVWEQYKIRRRGDTDVLEMRWPEDWIVQAFFWFDWDDQSGIEWDEINSEWRDILDKQWTNKIKI